MRFTAFINKEALSLLIAMELDWTVKLTTEPCKLHYPIVSLTA